MRWDPCRPIHYRVSWGPLERTEHANLDEVIARASGATGIAFVYDGPANVVPTKENWPHAGVAGTDLLIAYSLPGSVGGRSDILDGLSAGKAGAVTDGLGLDHTSDLRQVMAYGYEWDEHWALGDLAGLRRLGREAGCPTAPAPVTGLGITQRSDGTLIAAWDPGRDGNVGGRYEVAVERTGASNLSYDFPTDGTMADFWPEREHGAGGQPASSGAILGALGTSIWGM